MELARVMQQKQLTQLGFFFERTEKLRARVAQQFNIPHKRAASYIKQIQLYKEGDLVWILRSHDLSAIYGLQGTETNRQRELHYSD